MSDFSGVLLDTNIFSAPLVPRGRVTVERWAGALRGRPLAVSFVTMAETVFGALNAGWGNRRMMDLERSISMTNVVWSNPEIAGFYVAMRVACREDRHPLAQKEHEADRWIAATAVYLDVPLASEDKIFSGVPGLHLLYP